MSPCSYLDFLLFLVVVQLFPFFLSLPNIVIGAAVFSTVDMCVGATFLIDSSFFDSGVYFFNGFWNFVIVGNIVVGAEVDGSLPFASVL